VTDQVLTVTLTKYIETRIFGDRPHIRGRRIPVSFIAYAARNENMSPDELAQEFALSVSEVLAALLYYKEHVEEIDAQEDAERAAYEENRSLHGTS